MGNSSNTDIVGVGYVCIQTNISCILTLKDVQHVSDLRLNMISLHALDLARYHNYDFGDGKSKLSKGLMVVSKGVVYNTLHKTQVKQVGGFSVVEDDALPNLWHKRLVHLSKKRSAYFG